MKFTFSREELKDLSKATKYEWIEKNSLGAYASSTIIGLNTRRSHGLLVVPYEEQQNKVVVLSKLEESVFVENRVYEVSTNQYVKNIYPHGYQYLEKFEINPFPKSSFRIEDRLLQKTMFLLEDENWLVVRYELRNQGNPIKLVIKPFLAIRGNNKLSGHIQGYNTDSYLGQHFVRWAPKAEMPEVNVYYNKGEFISATLWYHNFYYAKDEFTYKNKGEDLFNPGFFQVALKPYETFDMFISTTEISDHDLNYEAIYRQENERRAHLIVKPRFANNKLNVLNHQIQKSIKHDVNPPEISISETEISSSLRDVLITMPGLFLPQRKYDDFKRIFRNIGDQLDSGLLPDNYPFKENNRYGHVDLSLWYVQVGYEYLLESNDLAFFEEKMFEVFKNIFDYFEKGTTFNIYVAGSGLLFSGDQNINTGWIPLKTSEGSVFRYGHLLEVNALWYNALRILEHLSHQLGKKRLRNKFAKAAEKFKHAFEERFINDDRNGFYDFINNDYKCSDFRINQLLPLALPFSPVDRSLGYDVLQRIDRELLTPFGLRTLSVYHKDYIHKPLSGGEKRRQLNIFRGGILPWTISLYIQAGLNFIERKEDFSNRLGLFFNPVLHLMEEGVLGSIPQVIFSNHYLRQLGIEDYLPSAANIVWSYYLLKKLSKSD